MVKPTPLKNPLYSNLLCQIIRGETRPQQLKKEKKLSEDNELEYKRESKRLSKRLKQLIKTSEGYSFLIKDGWDYSASYQGILVYIIKEILKRDDSIRLANSIMLQAILKKYLLKANTEMSLNALLIDFVKGIGLFMERLVMEEIAE